MRHLVELALRYAPSDRPTFPHVTAFVDPAVAGPIETLRARWDPAMAAQIAAPVTVAYPEEVGTFDGLVVRLSAAAGKLAPFHLRLRSVLRNGRPDDGVFVAIDDVDRGWMSAREVLVEPSRHLEVAPHLTIVHPRTTNRGPQAWTELRGTTIDAEFVVYELAITAFDGRGWTSVARCALVSG